MLWIKRNLFLVIGGLIALGLVGFGGYYFWSNYSENKEVEGKLNESRDALKHLYELKPFPSRENIEKARQEVGRLTNAINLTKKSFTPLPYERVKGPAFKTLLDTTIDELQKKAAQAGVGLPLSNGYAFTFAEQEKRLQFSEGSFPTLTEQLAEIKAICAILFDAKINRLTGLRRGRVTTDDPPAASDYHEMAPNRTLPSGAVISPYITELNSFSSELAAVLEGFDKSPNGLLVKAIEVTPIEEKPGLQPQVPNVAQPPQPNPNPTLIPANNNLTNTILRRPLPPPGTPPPGTPPRVRPPAGAGTGPLTTAGAPTAGEALKTILDEKMLKITLWIDVLKPPPAR